ncbi:20560_t:CDS:1, partial [Funneliformis geosporum]
MARLKEEERIQICTLLDEKLYMLVELAKRYSVSISTITRLYNKYKKTQTTKDLPKTGRPRKIHERGERQVIRYIKSGECSNATE